MAIGDVSIAFDSRTNSLVVSAPGEAALDRVEALTRILDQENEPNNTVGTYNLELFWLVEGGDEEPDDSGETAALDRRIANAVIELERHGFARARQLGHLSVVVKSGGEFRVRSNESAGQLHLFGELGEINDRQLELKIELEILAKNEEIASLMTEINTQVDHEVVIGIASATRPERRCAFVIRVEKVRS